MTTRLIIGDCREKLRELADESVHCVVTSPPYWGLRDYGTAKWEGGDEDCEHTTTRRDHNGEKQATSAGTSRDSLAGLSSCRRCGAQRIDSQLGLEQSPDEYLASMVAVFREVRRVLRKDGTCWINMGDSYAGAPNGRSAADTKAAGNDDRTFRDKPFNTAVGGLKPKDLCGIPWRLAFALQADGWWLRQDIVWSKPNPMPESVTDRCTKAHEYVFLLSKSARYYFDAEAIKEPTISENRATFLGGTERLRKANICSGGLQPSDKGLIREQMNSRNKRSVWEIPSHAFREAHFATFPPALVEPCILAGCPKGGTILDPFSGAGTVGLVADRLQRNAVLIELNPKYAEMSERRIGNDAPLFAEVTI
jgi:DNA modification methylase